MSWEIHISRMCLPMLHLRIRWLGGEAEGSVHDIEVKREQEVVEKPLHSASSDRSAKLQLILCLHTYVGLDLDAHYIRFHNPYISCVAD